MKKTTIILLCVLMFFTMAPFVSCGDKTAATPKSYYIGESQKSKKGIEYTVTKVTNTNSYIKSYDIRGLPIDPITNTTENNYVIVEVKVVNHTTSDVSIGYSGNRFWLSTYLDMGNTHYKRTYDESSKSKLIPEESCSVFLVYETIYTTNEREYTISIQYTFLSKDSTVKIILKNPSSCKK